MYLIEVEYHTVCARRKHRRVLAPLIPVKADVHTNSTITPYPLGPIIPQRLENRCLLINRGMHLRIPEVASRTGPLCIKNLTASKEETFSS